MVIRWRHVQPERGVLRLSPCWSLPVHEHEPWVSVDEVAKHLGIAKDTVYRWIDSKALPGHRVGRLWKFKLSKVDAWIEAGGAADHDADEEHV